MTKCPHSVDVGESLIEARRLMRHHNIRHLPVLRHGEPLGLLSDRDANLVLGPDFDYPSPRTLTVTDAYAEPYIADEQTPLEEALGTMVARHIGSTLITRNGQLSGIFTAMDACRVLAERLVEDQLEE